MANKINAIMIHGDNFGAIRKLSAADRLALLEALMCDVEQAKRPELSPRAEVVKDYIDEQNTRFRKNKRGLSANAGNADIAANADNSGQCGHAGARHNRSHNHIHIQDINDNGDRAREAMTETIIRDDSDLPPDMLDKDAARINDVFTQNIRMPSGADIKALIDWLDIFIADVICYAIKQASLSGGRSYRTVETILLRWQEIGVHDLGSAEAAQREWSNRNRTRGAPSKQPASFDGLQALHDKYAEDSS